MTRPPRGLPCAPVLATRRGECQRPCPGGNRARRSGRAPEAGAAPAAERPIEGKVVAVGNGKVLKDGKVRPLEVHVGDVVLFGKYSGTEIKLDGEEHVLIREDDILAVTQPAS